MIVTGHFHNYDCMALSLGHLIKDDSTGKITFRGYTHAYDNINYFSDCWDNGDFGYL